MAIRHPTVLSLQVACQQTYFSAVVILWASALLTSLSSTHWCRSLTVSGQAGDCHCECSLLYSQDFPLESFFRVVTVKQSCCIPSLLIFKMECKTTTEVLCILYLPQRSPVKLAGDRCLWSHRLNVKNGGRLVGIPTGLSSSVPFSVGAVLLELLGEGKTFPVLS